MSTASEHAHLEAAMEAAAAEGGTGIEDVELPPLGGAVPNPPAAAAAAPAR